MGILPIRVRAAFTLSEEWHGVIERVRDGGVGAVVCRGIGAAKGLANGVSAAEKAENVKWGAIFGIFIGVALGVVVIATN